MVALYRVIGALQTRYALRAHNALLCIYNKKCLLERRAHCKKGFTFFNSNVACTGASNQLCSKWNFAVSIYNGWYRYFWYQNLKNSKSELGPFVNQPLKCMYFLATSNCCTFMLSPSRFWRHLYCGAAVLQQLGGGRQPIRPSQIKSVSLQEGHRDMQL